MTLGSNLSGFENEYDLRESLSNKTYEELNNNLKNFVHFLFPNVKCNDRINCYKGLSGQKPDIVIKVNNSKKNISIKKGSGNSVHQEDIDSFIDFLATLNISDKAKIELIKYHWADGTTDGKGKIRVSSAEYKSNHKEEIRLINNELNEKDILVKIITRILFKGKSDSYEEVDAIYYGNEEKGLWASKDEIINYIVTNKFSNNSIHFGPLTYQIWNRCLNFNPKTENRRNVMQVKWGTIEFDLSKIMEERVYYE